MSVLVNRAVSVSWIEMRCNYDVTTIRLRPYFLCVILDAEVEMKTILMLVAIAVGMVIAMSHFRADLLNTLNAAQVAAEGK